MLKTRTVHIAAIELKVKWNSGRSKYIAATFRLTSESKNIFLNCIELEKFANQNYGIND